MAFSQQGRLKDLISSQFPLQLEYSYYCTASVQLTNLFVAASVRHPKPAPTQCEQRTNYAGVRSWSAAGAAIREIDATLLTVRLLG